MRTHRRWIAGAFGPLLASAAVAASAPTPAAAGATSSYTVVTREYYVSRIGPFRPAENPRLAAAIRAFGRPSRLGLVRGSCRAEWTRIRLRITFENFGGAAPGQTTCTPSVGRAQSFVARGSRFRTVEGLRVGDRSDTILDRHPDAEFQPEGFWALVLATYPFGDDEPAPVLNALVRRGRVSALAGYIGGAGE